MKIEIKLDDIESCRGCLCANHSVDGGYKCWHYNKEDLSFITKKDKLIKIIRPEKCIKDNGE